MNNDLLYVVKCPPCNCGTGQLKRSQLVKQFRNDSINVFTPLACTNPFLFSHISIVPLGDSTADNPPVNQPYRQPIARPSMYAAYFIGEFNRSSAMPTLKIRYGTICLKGGQVNNTVNLFVFRPTSFQMHLICDKHMDITMEVDVIKNGRSGNYMRYVHGIDKNTYFSPN